MSETMPLRSGVSAGVTPEGLVFTDRAIDLTVEIAIEDGSAAQLLLGPEATMAIDPEARNAEDVLGILRSAGLLKEGLTPGEVRRRQSLFQLRQFMAFIQEEVPYYRAQAAYTSVAINCEEDIRLLPILTKADIRAHFLDLLSAQVDLSAGLERKDLSLLITSGSTGERLQAILGNEVATDPGCYAQVWTGRRWGEPPKVAIFTTPICSQAVCHLGKASYEERILGNVLFLDSTEDLFSIDRQFVAKGAEELHRFAPEMLHFNPVYLHWFVRRAKEFGIPLPSVGLLASSYQYQTRFQRKAIEHTFSRASYDWYGATEAATAIGQECPSGRLHVRVEQCVAEIVGPEGPVEEGELGAIVITTTASRTMPLARYRLGDVGSIDHSPCNCLLNGCPSVVLHGRAKDMLYLQDRWVTTRQFDEAIADTKDLDFYSCYQPDAKTLRIDAIPALGQEGTFPAAELADKLEARFGISKVQVKVVARLDPIPGSLKFSLTRCDFAEPPSSP